MIGGEVQTIYLVKGAAEGSTPLNAFDNALLAAGIGDVNLVKVSSIVPPNARVVEDVPSIPRGAFVPCVYVAKTSLKPGEALVVGIGVGIARDGFGVIMEADGENAEQLRAQIEGMVEEAFRMRGLNVERFLLVMSEHRVSKIGCAFAGAVFW